MPSSGRRAAYLGDVSDRFIEAIQEDPVAVREALGLAQMVVAGPGIDPTGVADSTAAIQALLTKATQNSTTAFGFGSKLSFPPGRFKVSDQLLSDLAKGLIIEGAGRNATYLIGTAALAGKPLLRLQDYYHVTVRDMTIQGDTGGRPYAAIDSHRERNNGVVPSMICQKLHVTDVHMTIIERGISWTLSNILADGNNDQSVITGCLVNGFTVAAYDIQHLNSVWHRFVAGEILSGPIGWRMAGGSFNAFGVVLGNMTDVEIDVTPGTYIHPTTMTGVNSEDAGAGCKILRTAAVSNFNIMYVNYDRTQSAATKTMIDFQAVGTSSFEMITSFLDLGQLAQSAVFADSTSTARFTSCPGLGLTSISYNGKLQIRDCRFIPGTVTLTNLGAGVLSQWGNSGAGFNPATDPKIEEFTASGTWTKAAGAKTVEVILIPSGGGGGSGRRGASGSVCGGGGGGAAGAVSRRTFDAADLTATVGVSIGAAGTGGAAVTVNDTNGNPGANAGNVSFGAYVSSEGGRGGSGGTTAGGAGGPNYLRGTATTGGAGGIGGTGAVGGTADPSSVGSGGAGGGGGISATPAAFNGGPGGGSFQGSVTAGGVGGIVDGTSPTAGTAALGKGTPGGSPGGGASSITTAGQAGADAINYGAAGAGGGAALNGNNSGAGGAGKAGYALVITRFL